MEIIQTPWYFLGKFFLCFFGIPILILGILLYKQYESIEIALCMMIILMLPGIFCVTRGYFLNKRLNSLKIDGYSFEAEILSIIPAVSVRIGHFIIAKVECAYLDRSGNRCLIKSGYHLILPVFDNKDNICAKAYVDSGNPKKHYVELYRI